MSNRRPWWTDATTARQHDRPRSRAVLTALRLVTVTILASAGVVGLVTQPRSPDIRPAQAGGIEHRPSDPALLAQCGGVFEFTPDMTKVGTVPFRRTDGSPNYVPYETIVPTFGPFWDVPGPTDAFNERAVPAEALLRSMWEGKMVAYYNRTAGDLSVAALKNLAEENPDLNMVVVPWPDGRPQLPMNRNIAYAVWGASQTCHTVSPRAILDFRKAHPVGNAPGANGSEAPALTDATAARR